MLNQTAAYLRVSTDDQTAENQRQKIEAWRKNQGLAPGAIDYFIEEGRSGADDTRPILEGLIDQVRAGVYNRVIVVAFDRWFRSLEHFVAVWNEFRTMDIQLLSLREPLPGAGPFADFMAKLFALLGELELGIGKERTRDGMNRRKAQGGHVSRPFLYVQMPSKDVREGYQGFDACWMVYRHEPHDPAVKGGPWRNKHLGSWNLPGKHESRNVKARRFNAGAGTISRLAKCVETVTDPQPGARLRWGRPIGGGPEAVLSFVDGRWRPIGVPIGPINIPPAVD